MEKIGGGIPQQSMEMRVHRLTAYLGERFHHLQQSPFLWLEYVEFGGMETIPDAKFHLTHVPVQNYFPFMFDHKSRVQYLSWKGNQDPIHLPTTPMIIGSWEVKKFSRRWLT